MVIAVDACRLAYMALPKAGCSSVKQMLAALDPSVSVDAARDTTEVMQWHRIYRTRRFDARHWQRYRDYFRFCVVRDPAKRLMSCYTDIVAGRNALGHSPRVRAAGHLPLSPDPDAFFLNFFRYRKLSSLVRHHVLPAEIFLGPDLAGDYDRVFRTSEMAELARALSARSGSGVTMPHANATGMSLSVHGLSGAAIDVIRPVLDREYDYLAAFFRNPLGPRLHESCAMPEARVS